MVPVLIGSALLIAAMPAVARKTTVSNPTGLRGVEYGRPAPDFVYDAGGGTQRLSELAGHVVIVHFWASWCKPCLEEMPLFNRLREKYGPGVAVVTLPWHEPVSDARNRAQEEGWNVPVASDVSGEAVRGYGIEEVPTTVILTPDRTVVYVSVGEASWEELAGATSRAIGLPATSAPSIDPSPRL